MVRLNSAELQLQDEIHMGPTTVQLSEIAEVSDALRPQTTTRWGKFWNEQSYDFPASYITTPPRVMDWQPVNTYAIDQNTRFSQRYSAK